MTQQEVKEALGLQIGAEGVGTCEKLLESAGVLERLEAAENTAAVRLNSDLPTLVDLLPQQAKVKRQVLRAVERLVGPQRNEWCYFQPRELLRAARRHVEQRPRRAICASCRRWPRSTTCRRFAAGRFTCASASRPFDELEIDFETLERRKAAEYERLEHVLRFARSHGCRQQEILQLLRRNRFRPAAATATIARPASRAASAAPSQAGQRPRARSRADRAQRRGPRRPAAHRLRQATAGPDALRLQRQGGRPQPAGQAQHVRPARRT